MKLLELFKNENDIYQVHLIFEVFQVFQFSSNFGCLFTYLLVSILLGEIKSKLSFIIDEKKIVKSSEPETEIDLRLVKVRIVS